MTEKLRKGKFVGHIACTSCPSSDAMSVYRQDDGSYDATCFSCGHYEPDPYGGNAHSTRGAGTAVEQAKEPDRIHQMYTVDSCSTCPHTAFSDRGIRFDTNEFYGVRAALNGADGHSVVAHLYPYFKGNNLTGYKKRDVKDKNFWTIGDCKDVDLFGMHLFAEGGRRVYITEGELDALSLFQALKDEAGPEYRHLNPAVVSLPHGANSVAKSLSHNVDFLSKFEKVILCFDQDEAGQKAVEDACSILDPTKTHVAKLTEKDANVMLMAGKARELKWACINAQTYTPSGIATVDDFYDAAITSPSVGKLWPWPSLTRLTYGRKPGLYGFGAGVGVGKTEVFHEIIEHIVYDEQRPVGIFLLEEAPARTIRILGGKRINKPVHRPDCNYSQEELQRAIDELRLPNKVYIFDHRGERNWKTIYNQCRHLISVHGISDIFIDPLTAVISHEENTDRTLHAIMDDMSRLTHDPYNASLYFSSHLNEPSRDRTSHEEGGRVTESQFAGSRAMVRFSDYIFGLERNKQHEDEVKRNTVTLRVLKDRMYGSATGETFDMFYNHTTGRMLELESEF